MLRERWILLLLGLVAGVLGGVAFSALEEDTYTASGYAVVVPEDKDPASFQSATSVAQGYARVATKPNLVTFGLARQGVPMAPDAVQRYVRASSSPDTPIIEIFATRPDRREATRLADAVIDGLVANSATLRPGIGYRIQRFVATSTPAAPSNPSVLFYAGLGGAGGLLLGGLGAFLLGQSSRSAVPSARRFARPSLTREATSARRAGHSRE
jgi:capsular polysaccharide biosynthesis protein